jgi:hypothetical protein
MIGPETYITNLKTSAMLMMKGTNYLDSLYSTYEIENEFKSLNHAIEIVQFNSPEDNSHWVFTKGVDDKFNTIKKFLIKNVDPTFY